MGKVIKSIITTIVSVGIGFITGGPLGAALAFAGSAVGFLLGALGPKPKKPKFNADGQLTDRQQVVRQSIQARDVVYGTAVKSGTLVYATATGTGNKNMNLVVAVAGHACKAIRDIWLNDEIIGDRDTDGNVTSGRFNGKARSRVHLGAEDQAADDLLVAESTEWTTAHRLRGITYLYHRLQWDQTTYPTGIPNPKAKLVGRPDIYDPRDGISRWTNNWALVIRDKLIRPRNRGGWGAKPSEIPDDYFIAAANVSDEMVPIVHQDWVVTASATTDELTLSDANGYVWGCDGVQLTGALPGGLSAGVTYFWIETGQHKGKLAASLTAARDGTAIDLTTAGSGTITLTRVSHPRYTLDGVYSQDEQPLDVLEDMVQAGGGWLARAQGQWRIWAAAAAATEHEIDGSWLRDDGKIGLQTRPGRQDLFNTVRPTYVDPARFWKENQAPDITSTAYQTEDGGEKIPREFEFGWQINGERAQRVGAIILNRHRLSDVLTLPCNWKAWEVAIGNAASVTLPIFGYEGAAFRCTGFKFAENFRGIDLTLQRDDPAVYAWTAGQAQTYAAAPPVTLFEPWNVPPPTDLAISDDPIVATGGASVPALKATWTAADDAFVVGYEVEYKLHADPDWISAGSVAAAPAWVYPVTIGAIYDVRVTAIRGNGARSVALVHTSFTAGGDTTAPGVPTGISATGQSGGIQLAWTNDSAADLAVVEVWRNDTNDSGTASKIYDAPATVPGSGGSHFDTIGSALTRYYWLKSRDGSGNASAFSGVVSATST